jgi:hypothetical protein
MCPTSTSLRRFCGATDKPKSAWFWGTNQEIVTVILSPKSPNHSRRFWGLNRETITAGFEAKPAETVAAGFEVKPLETATTGFDVKPLETVTASFEAEPPETIPVVLMPNHWQTVAIGFEAQTDEKPSE